MFPPLTGSQAEREAPVAVKTGMSPMLGPEILGCRPLQSHNLQEHQVVAQ